MKKDAINVFLEIAAKVEAESIADDLHPSEWGDLIRSMAKDLQRAAEDHEETYSDTSRGRVLEQIDYMESVLRALRDTLSRTAVGNSNKEREGAVGA